MRARALRVAQVLTATFVVLCSAGAATAWADSDLFVGVEPYGSGVQQRAFGVHDDETRTLTAFVARIGDAANGVVVQVDVPAGVTIVGASPSQGTFDATTNTWSVGTVDGIASQAPGLLLDVRRTAPGDHDLVLRITSTDQPDPDPADNLYTAIIHEPLTLYAGPGAPAAGNCRTAATACDLRYVANAVDGVALDGDIVRVLPGDYELATGLNIRTHGQLVGDDPSNKPRIINTGTQSMLLGPGGGERFADLELVDAPTSTNNAALSTLGNNSTFEGSTIERVVIRSTRTAISAGANTRIRDSIAVGGGPSLAAVRTNRTGVVLENVTAINTNTGPGVDGNTDTRLRNTIARSAGAFDITDIATATRSNFGTSSTSPAPGSGDNQTDAPVFVDAPGGDYHQAATSPTVDAGAAPELLPSSTQDVDGGRRTVGVSTDIGGDERGAAARLTPKHHDYGTVLVNGIASQTFTVRNVGTLPLSITGIDAASPMDPDPQFGRVPESDTCRSETLQPGATCTFVIQFRPTSAGPKEGQVALTTNAGRTTAALSGLGVAPEASLTPTSHDFGAQLVGATSGAKTFAVTNTGTVDVAVSGAVLAGTDDAQFSISRSTCGLLIPQASCEVDVTFTPTSPGAKAAELQVSTSAGTKAAGLAGTGVAPQIELSPESQAFGDQQVGTPSAAQTFTVSNPGSATLNVAGVTLVGTNPDQFAVTRSTCAAVAPSGSCEVDVTFAPTSTGAKTATLRVASDAGERTAALSGTGTPVGVPTRLTAAPVSLDLLGVLQARFVARATLKVAATGQPLPGRIVRFTVRGAPLCTATTDHLGIASCSGLAPTLSVILGGGYDAHFAGQVVGNVAYQPSSTHGALVS